MQPRLWYLTPHVAAQSEVGGIRGTASLHGLVRTVAFITCGQEDGGKVMWDGELLEDEKFVSRRASFVGHFGAREPQGSFLDSRNRLGFYKTRNLS